MRSEWLCGWLASAALVVASMGCGSTGSDAEGEAADGTPYPTAEMKAISPNDANAAVIREVLASRSTDTGTTGPEKVVTNDGWVDVTGMIQLVGQAPDQRPVDVTKDEQVCAPGGGPVFDGSMIVGPNNGIGNVLIFVSSDVSQDWEHESHRESANAELTGPEAFDQKNCIFKPHVFAMRAGQRLQVLNSDPIGHNTNIAEFGYNVTIGANDSTFFEPSREKRTPFQVRCSIHPWMQAWMITRDNPYFAVTNDDGSFTIPKVPAGVELEFTVWHERSRMSKFTVNGSEESRKFVRTLSKDGAAEFNLSIDGSQFDG